MALTSAGYQLQIVIQIVEINSPSQFWVQVPATPTLKQLPEQQAALQDYYSKLPPNTEDFIIPWLVPLIITAMASVTQVKLSPHLVHARMVTRVHTWLWTRVHARMVTRVHTWLWTRVHARMVTRVHTWLWTRVHARMVTESTPDWTQVHAQMVTESTPDWESESMP